MVITGRKVFGSAPFVIGVIQSAACLGLGVGAMHIVSPFERILQDFGTAMPTTTRVVLSVTHILDHYWYLAILLLIAWPWINHAAVSTLSPRPEIVVPRRIWYHVTSIGVLLFFVLAVIAVLLPLVDLCSRLVESNGS